MGEASAFAKGVNYCMRHRGVMQVRREANRLGAVNPLTASRRIGEESPERTLVCCKIWITRVAGARFGRGVQN